MADEDTVISFADEVKKRTGVVLDENLIAQGVPKPPRRIRVGPEDDLIVKLALDILSLTKEHVDKNPIAVIAALQLVGSTTSDELEAVHGKEKTVKMVLSAKFISDQYKPEYKPEEKSDVEGELAGEVEGDSKD